MKHHQSKDAEDAPGLAIFSGCCLFWILAGAVFLLWYVKTFGI